MTHAPLNPVSPIAPSSDASAVIAKAALSICCFSDKPSLRQEISDRLGLVKDALDCLDEDGSMPTGSNMGYWLILQSVTNTLQHAELLLRAEGQETA